jgi:hypothetical protein
MKAGTQFDTQRLMSVVGKLMMMIRRHCSSHSAAVVRLLQHCAICVLQDKIAQPPVNLYNF